MNIDWPEYRQGDVSERQTTSGSPKAILSGRVGGQQISFQNSCIDLFSVCHGVGPADRANLWQSGTDGCSPKEEVSVINSDTCLVEVLYTSTYLPRFEILDQNRSVRTRVLFLPLLLLVQVFLQFVN